MQTIMAHCCVMFCTNDWRYKDEYRERTGKELHLNQFPADKKRSKEWIDRYRLQTVDTDFICIGLASMVA